jgi:hypothetical protein
MSLAADSAHLAMDPTFIAGPVSTPAELRIAPI